MKATMNFINKFANTVKISELKAVILSNIYENFNDYLITILESRISESEFNEFLNLLESK